MTLTRRRFLTVSAAFAALPATGHAETWQGRAFGAEVSLTIRGPRAAASQALAEARRVIAKVEQLFSLYDPASDLVGLNAQGMMDQPDPLFLTLMQEVAVAYRQTEGLFDPTVQPLWTALAERGTVDEAIEKIGWQRVSFDAQRITLDAGQALTFNGIAQGFATDLVADLLGARGFTDTLVNIGEYRGAGGPWALGLVDPVQGLMGSRTLTKGAIATSSPHATPLGAQGHILHAVAQPQWSTVSVEAPRATVADSLSTAMVLAGLDQIEAIRAQAEITRVTLVDFDGNLRTL